MNEETITDRSQHDLPFGRTLNFKNVSYENGLCLLRMTFREGRRFTIIDLDKDAARALGADLTKWAKNQPENPVCD